MSHDSASSHPPPSAKPFTAAIVGCFTVSTVAVTNCPSFAYSTDSSGVISDMYSMSAPAENAFSPEPVIIITFTSSRVPKSLKVVTISFATFIFMAFSFSGRLIELPYRLDLQQILQKWL